MIRSRRFRSFLAMLLAFCLVSASLWSVSAEAMTDALADEVSHVGMDRSTDHGPAYKACNHGCHAQAHLAGFGCSIAQFITPVYTQVLWAQSRMVVPRRPANRPFRPPRDTFQPDLS